MGLFRSSSSRTSSSASDTSSFSRSDISSATSVLSKSSSSGKVKPGDLRFPVNSASPNSRILSVPVDGNGFTPTANRAASFASTDRGASSPSTGRPPSLRRRSSSTSLKGAPIGSAEPARRRSTASNASATGQATRAGQIAAGVAAVTVDDDADSFSSASSSDDDEFEDAKGGTSSASEAETKRAPPARSKGVRGTTPQPLKPGKTKAARLAVAKMEEDLTPRTKIGKKLTELTAQDVALTENDIREDISVIWKAMHLFMSSRMIEAEDICLSACDHRLYYSVGYSLIQAIKSLATFEPEDLEAAIQCCKDSITITQLLRKKDHGLFERVGSIAKGSTSVASIKAMTLVQRHAELVFAECTLLKAVLGIIYSGDFLAFLKEALNMRNAYAIYRTLAKYVETSDQEYQGPGEEDPAIDQDFRSGVRLGNGMISLILSLLPSAVLKIMEVFGFTGDRDWALATLMKAGGWKARVEEPSMDPEKEGIRRPICDMVLLMHHLVIANYLPVGGVDVPTAANILHYNLDRYPTGIFFLYFAGRLHSTETMLEDAIKSFRLAIQAQREYIQLGHICYWDLGLVSLAQGSWMKGYECFNILDKESNWSKAIYAYAKATTLYEEGMESAKANQTMAQVPDLMQRIAGKSIPLEKFVARRARKFVAQGNRLTLPGIELAYVLNCLGLSPRFVLFEEHLNQVSQVLADLHAVKEPEKYGKNGDEYWDDYCLAHLLRGIILRFIAHPEPHVVARPKESPIPVDEADEQALISFNNVLKHGRDISHDHHVVWFAHYELGRLYQAKGDWALAREQYELVMSGKHLEVNTAKKGKGKVSLQNMAVLRSNAGLQLLKEEGH
ncbi:hypothetical protein DMC30DRAFT_393124 [Rhodotorula diobovata]|uniref:Uncharacterized protein n=1 Tax=Rhodotorula diobovata TaxID=5288 RepID=A0A5C5G0R8_9BASI|nr:hypothetical protein DMC30DRAFT_393124 [Rhodotorula diobovata]